MGGPIRSAVTAIIQFLPGVGGKEIVSTKELVPMREEIFSADTLKVAPPAAPAGAAQVAAAFMKVQRHVHEATQSARSLPFLGGTYWPNVTFTANVARQFAHGVPGGVTVAFMAVNFQGFGSPVAGCVEQTAQDPKTGRITLVALPTTLGLTCDILFYAQPSALGGG